MRFLASAYWDIGKRKVNEDSLILQQIKIGKNTVVMAAVADGIGSLDDGEIASGYAVESLLKLLINGIKNGISKGKGLRFVEKLLKKEVYRLSENMKKYADLTAKAIGTTLSVLVVINSRYIIVHLGDTGIFRINKRNIKAITPFHNNEDGSLCKCVGSITFHEPFVKKGYLHRNAGFLLCTDGIHKKGIDILSKNNFLLPKDINSEEMIEKRLEQLGKKVDALGETDNKAAIYIKTY